MLLFQSRLLLEFPVHGFDRRFIGAHTALGELPAVILCPLSPQNLAIILHDDNRYVQSESISIDHYSSILGGMGGVCYFAPSTQNGNQFTVPMPTSRIFSTRSSRIFLAALTLMSLSSVVVGSGIGLVNFTPANWLEAFSNPDSPLGELLWRLRLPRASAAWTVGAMLSVSGCLMQVLLRNPLADPYILGVSGGAAFFVLLGITVGMASPTLPFLALAGALVSIILVFGLARGSGPWSGTRLLLTGVVTAAGWAALISLLLATGNDSSLRGMLFWLMGDLSYVSVSLWSAVLLVTVFVAALSMSRSLNVLSMGETSAMLLGESVQRLLWLVYLMASLLTAAAVSIAGSIGFVGLIVPHLMRLLLGSDHRILLPASALFGGLFLVLSDTLARTLLAPRQLPVGVITALLGVPLFLLLLNRARLRVRES